MKHPKRVLLASAFALACAGFLWPLWPLCVAGILLASTTGYFISAALIGVLLDVAAFGSPTGHLHFLLFPFTALAILGAVVRKLGIKYFLQKNTQERI